MKALADERNSSKYKADQIQLNLLNWVIDYANHGKYNVVIRASQLKNNFPIDDNFREALKNLQDSGFNIDFREETEKRGPFLMISWENA